MGILSSEHRWPRTRNSNPGHRFRRNLSFQTAMHFSRLIITSENYQSEYRLIWPYSCVKPNDTSKQHYQLCVKFWILIGPSLLVLPVEFRKQSQLPLNESCISELLILYTSKSYHTIPKSGCDCVRLLLIDCEWLKNSEPHNNRQ